MPYLINKKNLTFRNYKQNALWVKGELTIKEKKDLIPPIVVIKLNIFLYKDEVKTTN